MSTHHDFHVTLKTLWEKARSLYEGGNTDPESYFSEGETTFLQSVGHTARELFDFVDDSIRHGEPDFETFLLMAAVRRHYFLHVMNGAPGDKVVDTGDLPPKTDTVAGIEWLPRLIGKARAKLRGEMSDDLMFGCGGDRNFFKTHNIHPVELLTFVMEHFEDDQAIIAFVLSRSPSAGDNTVPLE